MVDGPGVAKGRRPYFAQHVHLHGCAVGGGGGGRGVVFRDGGEAVDLQFRGEWVGWRHRAGLCASRESDGAAVGGIVDDGDGIEDDVDER